MPHLDLMETMALAGEAVRRAGAAFSDIESLLTMQGELPLASAAAEKLNVDPLEPGFQPVLAIVAVAAEALRQEVDRAGTSGPVAASDTLGTALANLYEFLWGPPYGALDASDPTTPPWP